MKSSNIILLLSNAHAHPHTLTRFQSYDPFPLERYGFQALQLHLVPEQFAQIAPFALVVVAAVDKALLDQRYLVYEGSSVGRQVGEEWHDSLDVSVEAKGMTSVKQVCSLLMNLAIRSHY